MPIAVEMYPEKASAITAIIQMSLGLGLCVGPPVGSALLTLGGYKAPFLTVGAIELFVYIAGLVVIPSISPKTKAKIHSSDYIRYLSRFSTISVLVPTAGLFCLAGIRDTAYSLYFEDVLGVDSTVVGYVFLGNSVAFLLTGPVVGVLVEMGFGTYVGLFSQVFTPLMAFAFFLPKLLPKLENVAWAVIVLSTNGFSTASIMNPAYLVLEKVAIRQGGSVSGLEWSVIEKIEISFRNSAVNCQLTFLYKKTTSGFSNNISYNCYNRFRNAFCFFFVSQTMLTA